MPHGQLEGTGGEREILRSWYLKKSNNVRELDIQVFFVPLFVNTKVLPEETPQVRVSSRTHCSEISCLGWVVGGLWAQLALGHGTGCCQGGCPFASLKSNSSLTHSPVCC